MHYLTVDSISKFYGEVTLFSNISFSIHKNDKIGFIAKNGSGKTTILNIIAGLDKPDSGTIETRNNLNIAYLSQKPNLNEALTIEQVLFITNNQFINAIKNYNYALQNPEDSENYQKAFETMDRVGAWDYETHYRQILFQLKLDNLSQKISTLSGGQKRRLALAIALINKPELLILDEPTNHLDLDMIEWLESYFAKENITLFMVTHDRYFLDRVCNDILELDNGKVYSYSGNYSYFLEQREHRLEVEQTELGKAKQLYKKELDWMRRQPKARTTKSKSRIDDFHSIKQQAHQRRKDHQIQLELNMERLGNKVLELHNIGKSYEDNILFKSI